MSRRPSHPGVPDSSRSRSGGRPAAPYGSSTGSSSYSSSRDSYAGGSYAEPPPSYHQPSRSGYSSQSSYAAPPPEPYPPAYAPAPPQQYAPAVHHQQPPPPVHHAPPPPVHAAPPMPQQAAPSHSLLNQLNLDIPPDLASQILDLVKAVSSGGGIGDLLTLANTPDVTALLQQSGLQAPPPAAPPPAAYVDQRRAPPADPYPQQRQLPPQQAPPRYAEPVHVPRSQEVSVRYTAPEDARYAAPAERSRGRDDGRRVRSDDRVDDRDRRSDRDAGRGYRRSRSRSPARDRRPAPADPQWGRSAAPVSVDYRAPPPPRAPEPVPVAYRAPADYREPEHSAAPGGYGHHPEPVSVGYGQDYRAAAPITATYRAPPPVAYEERRPVSPPRSHHRAPEPPPPRSRAPEAPHYAPSPYEDRGAMRAPPRPAYDDRDRRHPGGSSSVRAEYRDERVHDDRRDRDDRGRAPPPAASRPRAPPPRLDVSSARSAPSREPRRAEPVRSPRAAAVAPMPISRSRAEPPPAGHDRHRPATDARKRPPHEEQPRVSIRFRDEGSRKEPVTPSKTTTSAGVTVRYVAPGGKPPLSKPTPRLPPKPSPASAKPGPRSAPRPSATSAARPAARPTARPVARPTASQAASARKPQPKRLPVDAANTRERRLKNRSDRLTRVLRKIVEWKERVTTLKGRLPEANRLANEKAAERRAEAAKLLGLSPPTASVSASSAPASDSTAAAAVAAPSVAASASDAAPMEGVVDLTAESDAAPSAAAAAVPAASTPQSAAVATPFAQAPASTPSAGAGAAELPPASAAAAAPAPAPSALTESVSLASVLADALHAVTEPTMAEDEAAAPTGSPAAATPTAVAAAPAAAAAAAPADAPSTPTAAAPSPSAAAAAAAPAASSSAKLVKYPIPQGPIDVNDWLLDINSRVKPTEGFVREVQGRGMYYVAKLMIKHEYHGKIIGENGRTVKWLLQHSPKKFFKNTPSLLVTTPKKIHTNDHNVYVKSTELPNLKFIVGLVLELATVFTEEESALKVLKRRIRDAEKEVARYVKERDQIYWEFPELKPKPPAKRPRSDTLAPPPSKAVKTQADQTPQTAPKVEGAAIKAEIKPDAAAAPATPAAAAPGARPDNLPPLEPGPSVASATVAAASPSSAAAAPATPTPTTPTAEAAMEVEDFDGFHSPQLSDNELLDLNRSGPTPFSLRLDFEGENDELEGFPGDVERGPQSDEEADETGETGAHDESHADESAEVEAEAEVEGETPADEQPDQDVQPEDEPSDETRRDDDEEQLDVGDQEHPDVGDLQSDAELYDPRTPEGQMAEGEEQQPEGEEYAAADGDEFGGETHPDDGAVDEYGASHAEDEAQPQDIEQEETGAASSDDHGAAASDQVEQGVEPPPEGVAAAEAPAADQGGDVAPATDVPPSDASAEGANDAPAPMEVSEHADSSATA